MFSTEADWKAVVEPASSRDTPPTPNIADGLVLAVRYGEVAANQTGGEIASVGRRGEHVLVRVSQRVQTYPIAMTDVFEESFVRVAKAAVGESARFDVGAPSDVGTVYGRP